MSEVLPTGKINGFKNVKDCELKLMKAIKHVPLLIKKHTTLFSKEYKLEFLQRVAKFC